MQSAMSTNVIATIILRHAMSGGKSLHLLIFVTQLAPFDDCEQNW